MVGGAMEKQRIAVFANGWSNEFLEKVIGGIRKEAQKDCVDIFLFLTYLLTGDQKTRAKGQMNIFHLPHPEDYDGVIMLTNTFNLPDEQERVLALFQKKGVPIVSAEVKIPGIPMVGSDNYSGFYEMSKHLLEKHDAKRVVYVSGFQGNVENSIRKQALVDALKEKHLKLYDEIPCDFGFFAATTRVKDWLAKGNQLPDAFVCANDLMALGTISGLHELGIEVPDNTLVTGFDNIKDSQCAIPMIATVSRNWDVLGKNLYEELKRQMACPNPDAELVSKSTFIPSESSGDTPTKKAIKDRLEKLRGDYRDRSATEMQDYIVQSLRVSMANVENIQQFNEAAANVLGRIYYLSNDYWIMAESDFFEQDDENYPKRIRGYSKKLNVIYEKRNGVSMQPYQFNSRDIVPNYTKMPGESNLYMVTPLTSGEYTIGYFAIKNSMEMVYDLSLRKWITNLDTMFVTIRQYIFAQIANRKLKQIYMTDFLTGIYNRTGCETVLFEYIKTARETGKRTVLLFADINGMKTINDVFGHLNGDIAIKATADAMKKSLGEGWLCGRYGGDEFVAVGACPDEQFATKQKNALAQSMANVIQQYNLSFKLTVSVGFTVIETDDEGEIEDFVRRADESMYVEKEKAHRKMDR